MTVTSEPPSRRLGLPALVLATLAFALVIPVGFLTLPLTALVVRTRPWNDKNLGTTVLATGLSLWWLSGTGTGPEQLVKAWALIGAVLVGLVAHREWAWINRMLMAVAAGAGATFILAVAVGFTWGELVWSIERDLLRSLQMGTSIMNALGVPSTGGPDRYGALMVEILPQIFLGVVALQMLLGMGLAGQLYFRLTTSPSGAAPGRLQDFSFSEHLGWLVAAPLGIVLFGGDFTAHPFAINLLAVGLGLYFWRGLAVFWAFFSRAAIPRPLFAVSLVLAIFLMAVTIPMATVVGVLDTGLDFRARMKSRE
ncbi:MAG: YybS family protein [Gemmatimonadota bacterium]|nr:YybS family protein [Gemmatimonadota bacterium]MDH5803735.1 YybS family protein [Gemmatimonadota bacterium]